jgi:hypothetical protein
VSDTIFVKVRHRQSGEMREVTLPASAWPFSIGRDASCAVVLDDGDLAEVAVSVARLGRHTMVDAKSLGPVVYAEEVVVPGEPARVDERPFFIGRFEIIVDFP